MPGEPVTHADPEARQAYQLAYWEANKGRRNVQRRERRATNPEAAKQAASRTPEQKKARADAQRARYASDAAFRENAKRLARESAARNKDGKRHYDRAVRYGITREQAAAMDAVEFCEATGLPLGKEDRDRTVDHDHETGKVRGVLNTKINMGIGLFNNDPVLLRAAADYLERTSAPDFTWSEK